MAEKAAQGFDYMLVENLGKTQFSKDARFLTVQYQTEKDIQKRYSHNGEYDVELVSVPNQKLTDFKKIMTEEEFSKLSLRDEEKSYYVFVRAKK